MPERAREVYYLEWLPRIRRALAPSGLLTELALTLAAETGLSSTDWSQRLRRILHGQERAAPDLVFRIDQFLARDSEFWEGIA